jgi:hypothetical protein
VSDTNLFDATSEIITVSEREITGTPNDQALGELVRARYSEARMLQNDRCVVCGRVSPYRVGDHIDWRVGYVEGAGQGCFQPRLCGSEVNP